jgi:hypothetical protein
MTDKSPTATLSQMQNADWYRNPSNIQDFCARQLLAGRLGIVLGAGASFAFGLPEWDDLVARVLSNLRVKPPASLKHYDQLMEFAQSQTKNDRQKFNEAVRAALYGKRDAASFDWASAPLLVALGSVITMSVRRGHAGVLSFNFDDYLRRYLHVYGLSVETITHVPGPKWKTASHVTIYHAHGVLSIDPAKAAESKIVITREDYDHLDSQERDLFRPLMLDYLASRTCLFIGLSGDDPHLTSLLKEAKSKHVAAKRGDKYWGFRFSDDKNDPLRQTWDDRGVFQCTLNKYAELPEWLLQMVAAAIGLERKHE